MEEEQTSGSAAATAGMGGGEGPSSPPPPSGNFSESTFADRAEAASQQPSAVTSQPPATPAGPKSDVQGPPPAPTPVSKHAGMFDQILQMLGGGPKKTYSVDASGKMQEHDEPLTRKQAMLMALSGALTGFAAGAQEHGPGANGRAFAAGADATIKAGQQRDDSGRQNANQDYQRQQQQTREQQEADLRKAQIFEANTRAILTSRQAENQEDEHRQHYIESSSPAIEAARAAEVNGVSGLKREHLTQAQLFQEHSQPGARHATSNIYLPDGEAAAIDPKTGEPRRNADGSERMEYTYAELDPAAQVELDGATLDAAVKNGYPVPGYTPGTWTRLSMPVGAAANLVHYNQGMQNFTGLVGQINQTLGLKDDKALDAQQIIQANPHLGPAVMALASHWDGQPSTLGKALQQMQAPGKDGRPSPEGAYARTIATAIGGDRLDAFNETLANQAEAKKTAAKTEAEERTKEPFVEGREDRNAQRAENRASQKEHAHDEDLVVAYDPGNDKNVVMAKGDLPRDAEGKLAQGWQHYPLKDPQQLAGTVSRFNDVQTKVNELAKFIQGGGMDHIQPGLVGDAIAEVNKEFEIGAFGAHVPTARLNAVLDKENYGAMNKASREFVRAYGFAREAMTQLPAIQTFGKSNRINDTQLKAALQLLPDGRMDGKAGMDQMNALQGILDPLRKGIPEMAGAKLLPSFRETGAPQAQQPRGAPGAQPQDPFAAFGGKARAATSAAGAR